MAAIINTESPFSYRAPLSRLLDADLAFRFSACLAVSRVVLPQNPRWRSTSAFSGTSVAAHDVLLALYDAQSAFMVSAAQNPYRDAHNGTTVTIPQQMSSERPYRLWWQAFNRAMYYLLGVAWRSSDDAAMFPCADIVYDADTPYAYRVDLHPYCLSATPGGVASLTPDQLATGGWINNADAALLVKVAADSREPYLITAGDIDFSFIDSDLYDGRDAPAYSLRALFYDACCAIGLTSYLPDPDDYLMPHYSDRGYDFAQNAARYWPAPLPDYDLSAMFRAKNLKESASYMWDGDASHWNQEFPYHGFCAMVAMLRYFESVNAGFIADLSNAVEFNCDAYRKRTRTRYYRATAEIPAAALETGGVFNFTSWQESTSTDTDTVDDSSNPYFPHDSAQASHSLVYYGPDGLADLSPGLEIPLEACNHEYYENQYGEATLTVYPQSGEASNFLDSVSGMGGFSAQYIVDQLNDAARRSLRAFLQGGGSFSVVASYGHVEQIILPQSDSGCHLSVPIYDNGCPGDYQYSLLLFLKTLTACRIYHDADSGSGSVNLGTVLRQAVHASLYPVSPAAPTNVKITLSAQQMPDVDSFAPFSFSLDSSRNLTIRNANGSRSGMGSMPVIMLETHQVFPPPDYQGGYVQLSPATVTNINATGTISSDAATVEPFDYAADIQCPRAFALCKPTAPNRLF